MFDSNAKRQLKNQVETIEIELGSLDETFATGNFSGTMRLTPHVLADTKRLITFLKQQLERTENE